MASSVVGFAQSPIPFAPSRSMPERVPTAAHHAAETVRDETARQKLRGAADWAAGRTPTEVREMEIALELDTNRQRAVQGR